MVDQQEQLQRFSKEELIEMLLQVSQKLEDLDKPARENSICIGDFLIKSTTCSLKTCIERMHKVIERHSDFELGRRLLKKTSYIG